MSTSTEKRPLVVKKNCDKFFKGHTMTHYFLESIGQGHQVSVEHAKTKN